MLARARLTRRTTFEEGVRRSRLRLLPAASQPISAMVTSVRGRARTTSISAIWIPGGGFDRDGGRWCAEWTLRLLLSVVLNATCGLNDHAAFWNEMAKLGKGPQSPLPRGFLPFGRVRKPPAAHRPLHTAAGRIFFYGRALQIFECALRAEAAGLTNNGGDSTPVNRSGYYPMPPPLVPTPATQKASLKATNGKPRRLRLCPGSATRRTKGRVRSATSEPA